MFIKKILFFKKIRKIIVKNMNHEKKIARMKFWIIKKGISCTN